MSSKYHQKDRIQQLDVPQRTEQNARNIDLETEESEESPLRWKTEDFSVQILIAIPWKILGLLYARLLAADGQLDALLGKFNKCVMFVKSLVPNRPDLMPSLRIVIEPRVPPPIPEPNVPDFDWATQAELERAACQVLGEDIAPSKSKISRAVTKDKIESNGESGRKGRVNVDSFLAWIAKDSELDHEEITQIRNAAIGGIRARK